MNIAGAIGGSVALLVMLGMMFILFGGGQLIAIMYASRQYRKSMEAWYRRTHKDDPMPDQLSNYRDVM